MNPVQTVPDLNESSQWLFRLALTVVTFFLGWGLKDVKKRYDKVPELEKLLVGLDARMKEIERRLDGKK